MPIVNVLIVSASSILIVAWCHGMKLVFSIVWTVVKVVLIPVAIIYANRNQAKIALCVLLIVLLAVFAAMGSVHPRKWEAVASKIAR